ncbi:MAG: pyridoxamine 5'-phosphate oxidase family protein [Alphaproteobacteria bacterium]|nr:pyridoxamine 5'-phosphate oxidase family protein [Alphaproteobacteria bacterium]
MGKSIDSRIDDFDAAWDRACAHLSRAVTDRKSPMHTPVFGTLGADGMPEVRTCTLRAFDADALTLRFHADVRSPKIGQLEADPRISVLLYDKEEKTQIRIRGEAAVHGHNALAEAAWDASRRFARRCYLQSQGPSSPSPHPTSGLDPHLEGREPTPEELVDGFPNFRAVVIHIASLDWVYLSHLGHRRALFTWDGAGARQAQWLVP